MADMSRLKKTSSLGAPPPVEEASANLNAPEHGPAAPIEASPAAIEPPKALPALRKVVAPSASAVKPRIDGRSLRRSTRVVTLATRVTPEFDSAVRQIAQDRGIMMVEVLEEALAAYQAQQANK